MSDLTADVMGGIDVSVPADAQREIMAQRVRGDGVDLASAQAALKARGIEPLAEGTRDYLESRKDALMADPEFANAYLRGDAGAQSTMYEIDLAIQSHREGKLTDKGPAASSSTYDPVRRTVGYELSPHMTPEQTQTYGNELAELSSRLQLPSESAAALTEAHISAMKETAGMSPDELVAFGDRQTAILHSALGENAEAQIAEANKVLSRANGKTLDLGKICRTNGSSAALNLLFAAQSLAARGK